MPIFMRYFVRILFICLTLLMIGNIMFQPAIAKAAEEQLGEFKDEDNPSYYHIEALPDDEADKGWFDKLKENHWWMDPKDSFLDSMNQFMTFLADVGFKINMLLTRLMLGAFDLAYSTNFMKSIIDKLDEVLQPITGVLSSGTFGSSGIFGNFAQFVAIFTAFYAVFLLVWKRSMIESLTVVLQTTVALAIALLLFTNYSAFLNGVNDVTTQASGLVLSGGSFKKDYDPVHDPITGAKPIPIDDTGSTPTGLNEDSLRMKMRDNLWSLFVDRPYLYLMYGQVDVEKIKNGKERVNKILKQPKGSDEREAALLKEVAKDNGYDNGYMKYSNTGQRLAFTPVYLTINGITSIPVYILALLLIMFQFWFMLIAALAPFALIFGAMPGQFNVVLRYFIELALPLLLKIVVAFGALMVFAISEVLYAMDFNTMDGSANTFLSYIAAAAIHFALFLLLFMLRHRIKNIFSAGSAGFQELRTGMQTFTSPIKSGVQGISTVGGAVAGGTAGAMTGGVGAVPGALAGASMGSSVGKAATGEGGVGDVARSAGYTAMALKAKPNMGKTGRQKDEVQTSSRPDMAKQKKDGTEPPQEGKKQEGKYNEKGMHQEQRNNRQETPETQQQKQEQSRQHGFQSEPERIYPSVSLQKMDAERSSDKQQEIGQSDSGLGSNQLNNNEHIHHQNASETQTGRQQHDVDNNQHDNGQSYHLKPETDKKGDSVNHPPLKR